MGCFRLFAGLVATLSVLAATTESFADRVTPAKIGEKIDNLSFKDIRYLHRSLDDLPGKKAYVLAFTNTTCPIVLKYLPKLKRLDEQYRDQGVQFLAVNVGPDDTIQDMAQQAIEYDVAFHFVKDSDGSCAKRLGVKRTPEVVVLTADRKLVYRGRIDDQQRLGGARPNVRSDDLARAIEDVLAGRQVATAETPVDGCLITFPEPIAPSTEVTFAEHVAPIMAKHCQECHHAGGDAAPFSLVTYDEVAAQGEMIAETVADMRMPPWYAHHRQVFDNKRGLTAEERIQVQQWVRAGMPKGDLSKAPAPREFASNKWTIGTPDLVITAPQVHDLPADGFVDYKYVILPHIFLKETWITHAEILPDNPAVVHHCNMAYGSVGKGFSEENFITGRVPGGTAFETDEGHAYRIPAGSVLALQIHYTTTGKKEKNRMSVGFRFPKGVVHKEVKPLIATTNKFAIPPGAPAHPVASTREIPVDAFGIGMFSHMHLRGKDMTFIAHYPDGKRETLLSIPNYNYDWQQNYRWARDSKRFPKGTKIEVVAHYDNSAFNPYNPDPAATVKHGPQTIHEMMFGFFFYVSEKEDLNLRVDPKTGVAIGKAADGLAKGD